MVAGIYCICLKILFLLNYVAAQSPLDPVVETKVGLIRGLHASDGNYSMFLGIPYAIVDEDNPFGLSIPHPGFNETFDAHDDSAICPQVEEFNNTIVGTLDCLHLNVYVPDSASSESRLPVLVYIYGGGFSIGFAGRHTYGPKYLVRHDVILVTLNYRLGPYGFMCLDIPEVPGNQGLKDQLIALRWIKDNIESFGGDSNMITLFGNSAGGMSVDLHLMSEQEHLFNRIILQSGTALIASLFEEPNAGAPLQLANQLGLTTENITQALDFLAQADPRLVISAAQNIERFRLCVEKSFDGVEKFITNYTVNREIPKAQGMPILLGFNDDEAIAALESTPVENFENWDIFDESLQTYFDFGSDTDTLAEMKKIVKRFYIGDEDVSEFERESLANLVSDLTYTHPTLRTIDRYLENDAGDIFFYVFSYVGARNFVKSRLNLTLGGAAHADEIGYLFEMSIWNEEPLADDQIIIDRMTKMWTNFAKYGNPTPEATDLLPVNWEPVKKDSSLYYLDINLDLSVGMRPFKERMAFWDLFYKANWKYQKGNKDE